MNVLIINEYAAKSTNYGNCLQSYALSKYIAMENPSATVEVAQVVRSKCNSMKTKQYTPKDIICRVFDRIRKMRIREEVYPRREKRIDAFSDFIAKNIPITQYAFDYQTLKDSNYDAYIVGSDVVWAQRNYKFSRVKFLDFPKRGKLKIAYAASFGRDWIPPENVKHIERCLSDFDFISVRESSSVDMLRNIGVSATHALDPTLLIDKEHWRAMEVEPGLTLSGGIDSSDKQIVDDNLTLYKYVFVYVLSCNQELYRAISMWAKKNALVIVTIPYASGNYNELDLQFGDIRIFDCSPQNWLWLVNHAEYVITDSFHGTVFSSIFEKRFVVVERKSGEDINNRMIDYLKTIRQSDKMISYNDFGSFDKLDWDYGVINQLLAKKREDSKTFLDTALRVKNKDDKG